MAVTEEEQRQGPDKSEVRSNNDSPSTGRAGGEIQ
jgi:hypothetical protein